jgi:HAD superfamily hydrolase (TIGR01509 family)
MVCEEGIVVTVGITYCDYGQEILVCKPKREMFEKAMIEADITDKQKCLFVDDSVGIPIQNCG